MNLTEEITTEQIIDSAFLSADEKAYEAKEAHPDSNGSEAWQAVKVRVDGRSKVAKELLKAGFERDYYWGIILTARSTGDQPFNNYFAEEAWTTEFARVLNYFNIPARRVERLL